MHNIHVNSVITCVSAYEIKSIFKKKEAALGKNCSCMAWKHQVLLTSVLISLLRRDVSSVEFALFSRTLWLHVVLVFVSGLLVIQPSEQQMRVCQQTHEPLHRRPIEPIDLLADCLRPKTGVLFALRQNRGLSQVFHVLDLFAPQSGVRRH